MTVISSRSPGSSVQLPTLDLSSLVSKSGVVVKITIDNSVDPIEMRVVEEAVWPYPVETLLVKTIDPARYGSMSLTIMDLVQILDKLGYPINYEELP